MTIELIHSEATEEDHGPGDAWVRELSMSLK